MSLNLDGSSGYLEHPARICGSYPFTMLVWVSRAAGSGDQWWLGQGQSNGDRYTSMWCDSIGNKFLTLRNPGSSTSATKNTTPNPDATMRLAVAVYTSATSRTLYFGDATGITSTVAMVDDLASHDRTVIGAYHYNGVLGNWVNGAMGEAHWYNDALSSATIAALIAKTLKPEDVMKADGVTSAWIDGLQMLQYSADGQYVSMSGTRTFTAVGGVTQGTATHPVTRAVTNAAPTFSGTIPNITGTGGSAIAPADVHALFSDTDTLTYSASPAGTAWPSGLVINPSTGVISGTVATSTTNGLKVRATDTASQTVDSNAFSVTIAAPASTVSGVTVTPATATVAGGGTVQLNAVVNGTGGSSQAVNWSALAGQVSSAGLFTAPAATSSAQIITVTATSAQDGTKKGTATITVPAAAAPTGGGGTIAWPYPIFPSNGGPRLGEGHRIAVYNMTTDALIVRKTGLTAHATTGVPPAITDALIVTGTEYRCHLILDGDSRASGTECIIAT